MTVREALINIVSTPVNDGTIDLVLINSDLIGTEQYSKALSESIEKAAIEVLQASVSAPDISEGGYSIRYDRNAIQSRLLFLARKHNRTDILKELTPTISSPSVW